MPEEQSTTFYFSIEVTGEEASKKAAELQEKLTKALTESVKPTKSLADAFGELDKRIIGTNRRIRQLIKMIPSEMKRIDQEVKKTLKVVEKDFEDLSDVVVGKSIIPKMVEKIAAEFDKLKAKHGDSTEAMKEHWKEYTDAARRILAEFFTVQWSEEFEKGLRAFSKRIINSRKQLEADIETLPDLAGLLRAPLTVAPGVVAAPPPPTVPPTFTQRMAAWSKDFTDAVQEASIGTWGLRRMGYMFQQLGRGVEASGKRIVTTLKSMVESYLEFNGVMAKTGASIGLTADATGDLSDEVVKAAKDIGFIKPEKVASGFEAWAQAEGALVDTAAERNKVLAQSVQITKLAELRNADLGKTTATVSAIMNVFDKDVSELGSVLAILNFVTAKSSMTLGDFGSFMQTVGPIAKDMGMTFEEVAASQLILAEANIRGNQAATAMRSIFRSLADPSDDFTIAMNELTEANVDFGYSWRASIEGAVTLPKFLDLVTQSTRDYTTEQYNAVVASLTNQRAHIGLATMLDATREAYKRGEDVFQTVSTSLEEAPGFWEKGWAAIEDSDRARAQRMRQRWDEVGRGIGKSLVEAGIEPAEKASELLESLGELLEKYPGLITGAAGVGVGAIGIGKLLAAVGTLLQIMVMYKMLAGTAALGVLGAAGAVGIGAGVVAAPYAKQAYDIATIGSEAVRKAFEKEIRFVWLPGPSGMPMRYMQAVTPAGEELLGGRFAAYRLEEYLRILEKIVRLSREASGLAAFPLAPAERAMFAGRPPPTPPGEIGGITTAAGEFIPPSAVEDFKSRMTQFVTDMKEIEDTYRDDSVRLTEQARERRLSVVEAYDVREIAANVNLTRQLEAIDRSAATSKERAASSHAIRLEQMQVSHHKTLVRAEEDFVRQMARAADDYARSEARAQEDFDAQRGKSRKQFQENEARDAERFKLRMERLEKDHVDKLRGIIRERDARGFIEEMLSYTRRKTEAQEDYSIRRRDARTSQAEQESDAQANFDKTRRRAQEDYERQRALAKEQYEFARARRVADYEDQRKLARAAFAEQLRLINKATADRKDEAYRAAVRALNDRDAAEEKELTSIDENLEEQFTKLETALTAQRGELWLHFWGIDGLRGMRDQFTVEEFQAIEDAHDDEQYFYESTVLPDTQSVWAKIFKAVSDEHDKIMEKAAAARAAYLEILNIQANLGGATGAPKQLGGYAPYGTYKLGESGREFVLSNMTTRALERRVGTLSQGAMLRLGSNGSGSRAPISVVLRQENWQFAGALSAAEKAELRVMARIGAMEAFDELTQKAWGD